MSAQMEIQLRKLKFHCFHGLDEGEDIVGGEFEVNVTIFYQPINVLVLHIQETIDYSQVYHLIKQRMSKPVHLLETLAAEIASEIIAKFSRATQVVVSVYKLHPPIEHFEGSVGVTFTLKKD